MKFNQKELEAIVRLTANPDFSLVVSGLARHTEELNKRLVMSKLDSGEIQHLQGQTKAMVLLMESIATARTALDSHKQPKV